jgi:toxin ParE1/3/4
VPRRKVRFGAAARTDLKRLLEYIIEASGMPRTALAYVDRIEHKCGELADFAIVGRDLGHIRPGLRSIAFEGVVIAFQVSDTEIRVRRVFGAAQDYESRLRPRK